MKHNKINRILAILLFIMMLITLMPVSLLATNEENTEFAGGNGTEDDPYLIATKEHLNNVRNHLNASFKMISDITFTSKDFSTDGLYYNGGKGWNPIGTDLNSPFSGDFDGGNFCILGLVINNISNERQVYSGLFGYAYNANIKNIVLLNSRIVTKARWASVGSIAGSAKSVKFDNCHVSGSVTSSDEAGGIVGYTTNGTIKNCRNACSVNGGNTVGGIVGCSDGTPISKCYNTGNIYVTDGSGAGGIVGCMIGMNNINIIECFNIGNVSARESEKYSSYSGGICGTTKGTIYDCYNVGTVSSTNSKGYAYSGGIAGEGNIYRCYNIGDVSASASANYYQCAGGILGYVYNNSLGACYYIDSSSKGVGRGEDNAIKCTQEQLKARDTFTKLDFNTLWDLSENSVYEYPTLRSNSHIDKTIKDISIVLLPSKLRYIENYDILAVEDGLIKIDYNNGVSSTVSLSKAQIIGFNHSTVGIQTLTVVYKGFECTYDIEIVEKMLESVSIIQRPNKLGYLVGDCFNSTGIIVTANYNNDTSEVITEYTIEGYNSLPGVKTITVTYEGKSAIFEVIVCSDIPTVITSNKYTVNNGYISRILASTTVKDFVSEFNEGYFCKVYKDGIEVSEDSVIESGMTVSIVYNDEIIISYKVAVTADINGDGAVNAVDSNLLKRIIAGTLTYDDKTATMFAADVNNDGTVNAVDSNLLKRVIAGTYIIPT